MKKLNTSKKNRSLLSLAMLLSLAFGHNYVCASDPFSIGTVNSADKQYTFEQKDAMNKYIEARNELNYLNDEIDKAQSSVLYADRVYEDSNRFTSTRAARYLKQVQEELDAIKSKRSDYSRNEYTQAVENAKNNGVYNDAESIIAAQNKIDAAQNKIDAAKERIIKKSTLANEALMTQYSAGNERPYADMTVVQANKDVVNAINAHKAAVDAHAQLVAENNVKIVL